MDGVQQGSITDLDNNTRRVEYAQLGAVSGVDNGTRGSIYFDAFESRSQSYIGLAPGAPAPPPFPERTDALFADGFEAGNFSAWSLSTTDGGDLSMTSQSSLNGTYGMAALLDDNNNLYVTDWSPYEEAHFRARFYFDPNSLPMTSGNAHYLFYALDRDSHPLLRVEFRYSAPDYQVRADAVIDNWSWSQTAWVTISDAPHLLELDWQAATAAGANNGVLTFWVDEAQQGSFTNLDNDTRLIDFVQWGIVGGVDNGSRGTLYFDAFESRRDSYIGPLAGLLRFEVALGEVQAQAIRWLGPAWDAAQVATRDLAASLAAHFRPAGLEPPAELEPVARVTSVAGEPAPVLDIAAIQYTTVLAPLTLEARITSIKVLAAPPPAEPAKPQPAPQLAPGYTTTRTITYTYDPLYRLTRANYSDGTYFRYTYDAVGNRLSEETTGGTVNSYTFDAANRLSSVDGMPYTWDNNGNLLSDGVYTYTFNHANRLVGVSGAGKTVSYTYSGLGDRLRETVNGVATTYTLDLAAGLTQVLADGTDMYLYGNGRIAQFNASDAQYFLGDALGSVRQLANANGSVTLAKDYQPYGEALASAGSGATSYGYTGEMTDDYIELVYLRSRIYSPSQGRFLSKDIWEGDYTKPASYNAWLYGYANPVRYVDPTGKSSDVDPYDLLYGIRIEGNWSSENKEFVRTAVVLVANKFADTLGTSMTGLPSSNPQALIFMAVYGIHRGDTLKFEWDPRCYGCRPDACMAENNVGGKKVGGIEYWEDDVDVPLPNGTSKQCDCKPTGGFTMSSHWIKFASMWSKTYSNVDERRVNNVIHELGHAFSARVGGAPATIVHTSPPPIEGDSWTLEQKPKGLYNAASGNMTWMQSKVESGSETFADMFLGWVFNKWEPDKYGNARAGFMNMNMLGWIRQAINLP